MRAVSCIPVACSGDEVPEDELVLCQCDLVDESFPRDEEELRRLVIREMVASEGNNIYKRQMVGCSDLRIYSGLEGEKQHLKNYVWFELVRHLTGHRVQIDSLKDKVDFSRWVCEIEEEKGWSLVMELESEGIVRKIAVLELEPVSEGEVDLFQMTNMLFQSFCRSNDAVKALKTREKDLESSILNMREERGILDKVLRERDEKTREIVVNLLNEKKKRIGLLEQELRKKHSSMDICDISDSDVINKNVKDAVSYLISPGKRKYRNAQVQEDQSQKKIKRSLVPELKAEPQDDFDDDFQFFGITKLDERRTPSSSTTPKKPEVKQETQDDKLPEIDSQRSDPILDSVSEGETDTDVRPASAVKDESSDAQSEAPTDTDISLHGDDSA